MKFAYPEFLFAFGILLIPIIIHLFNFKRYKTLYFSSLQFVKHVDQQTKSTQKLKHLLVLLSRLLAFSALILAVAQPYIPTKQVATVKNQPVMAFYIDNSFSMSATGTTGKLLSQAREATRKLVDKAAPGTNFMLLTNGLSGKEQRLVNKTELLDRLDFIDYTPIRRSTNTVINTIKDALDLANYEGSRQIILLSDFQQNSTDFSAIKTDDYSRYFPFQLTPQSTSNTYIDSVWFETPLRKVNTNNTLNVRIKNTDQKRVDNLPLQLEIGNYKREILVDIPDVGTTIAQLNYSDKSEGFKSGFVRIFDDQIDFDNTYYFSYEVVPSSNVLIVNGKEALNHPALVYKTDNFFNVSERETNQVQINELKTTNTLVLNSIKTFTSGLIAQVEEFTENGGSVLIIPAKDSDKGTYNRLLGKLSLPLLGSLNEQSLRLNQLNSSDPFFLGVFDKEQKNINLPMTKSYYTGEYTTTSNAASLISFENGTPFFVRQDNNLKAYAFYSGIDNHFGKISEHALFSTLLLRIGELSQDNSLLALTIGETGTFKVLRNKNAESALHIKGNEIDFIPSSQRKGAFDHISFNDAELITQLKAGNYVLTEDNSPINKLSINYNRIESDLLSYSNKDLNELMNSAQLNFSSVSTIEDIQDIEQLSLEKPLEYWRILLILATVFLILEILLLTLWRV
jgi:hypothetical protein